MCCMFDACDVCVCVGGGCAYVLAQKTHVASRCGDNLDAIIGAVVCCCFTLQVWVRRFVLAA